MGSLSRTQLIACLREVDIAGKRVLDCGCGSVNKYARNWAQGEPAEYHTLDVNPALKPMFVVNLNCGPVIFPDEGGPEFEHYDTAFLIETAEHLWHPLAALGHIHRWLVPGGELYFSAPFINPIHDTVDYLRLTEEWWRKAAEVCRFEVDYIKPRVATAGLALLSEFYRTEGLRMSKCRLVKGEGPKRAHIGYFGRMVKP